MKIKNIHFADLYQFIYMLRILSKSAMIRQQLKTIKIIVSQN